MKRLLYIVIALLSPLLMAQSTVVCTTSSPGTVIGSCAGSGFSSPVTTDPVSATGVWTFDNAANTPLTCSDGITSPSLASAAGANLAVSATAPAATTGASQAGRAVTVTASAAVASTDTAGAAAGGAVTITSGAAARLTSGNANGGEIRLNTGAGIGTGVSGLVVIGGGSNNGRLYLDGSGSSDTYIVGDQAAGMSVLNSTGTAPRAVFHAVSVETVATTKAASATESMELYTNGADVDGQAITLPNDPTVGTCYEFALTSTDSSGAFVIAPSAGETLSDAGTSCATVFSATAAGATARICAVSGGSGGAWFVMSKNGTWTCTP